ncbi:hypothetical protein ACFSX5_01080 [Devosia albogilva]|uniref:Glycosyltransferase RgtA/B/C/D-like domain-containing protein n=1 Tax=Devosia albogilva TaxID=429726 RepID=A0ABW5QEZ8_9HYPH
MSVLFSTASVILVALGLSIALRRQVEVLLPVTISSILLIGWIGGYLVPVVAFRPALWAAGVTALGYCITNRSQLVTRLSPGLAIFSLLAIAAYALSRGLLLLSWDEFSHWGQVVRFLLGSGRYPSTGDILFDGYPFGTAIWQILIGGNSEQNWIFAQTFLKLGGLAVLFTHIGWNRPHVYLPLAVVIVALLHLFVGLGGIGDILIDAPLAVFAGASLAIYFLSGRDTGSILFAALVAAPLPLFKDIGLVISLFVSGVILMDRLIDRLVFAERWHWPAFIASLLPAFLAYLVNRVRITFLGPTEGFNFSLSPSSILQGVAQDGFGQRFSQTMTTLGEAAGGWSFAYPGYDLKTVLLSAAALLFMATLLQTKRGVAGPITFGVVAMAGFCLYVGLLIILYLFSFSAYEGVRLASFQRYTNTFLLPIFIVGVAFLLRGGQKPVHEAARSGALIILMVFAGLGLLVQIPTVLDPSSNASFAVRASVDDIVREAPSSIAAGASTYVLWNGTNGEHYYMTMYSLTPSPVSRGCFSLGQPRHEGDVWSCDVDQNWFRDQLAAFDYVMLGSVDPEFSERFGDLFAVAPQRGWYSIEKGANGAVLGIAPIAPTPSP